MQKAGSKGRGPRNLKNMLTVGSFEEERTKDILLPCSPAPSLYYVLLLYLPSNHQKKYGAMA